MKEFNETEAIEAMGKAVAADRRDEDAITEVLDLIFDCYDENGQLDFDDDSEDMPASDIADYISRIIRKNPPAVAFTDAELLAMVEAELEYEESLLD